MPTVAMQATAKDSRYSGAYYTRVAKKQEECVSRLALVPPPSRQHKSTVTVTPDNCRMAFGLFQSLYTYGLQGAA